MPTITVTSFAEDEVDSVVPVIYPPQVAMIGIGSIRERPWVVAGVAAAAGFAASRFLKASSERRSGRHGTYQSYGASGHDRWDSHGDTIESSRYAGTGATPAH